MGCLLNHLMSREEKIEMYHKTRIERYNVGSKIFLHLTPLNKVAINPDKFRKLDSSDLSFQPLYGGHVKTVMSPHDEPNCYTARNYNDETGNYKSWLNLLNNGCIEAVDSLLLKGNSGIFPTSLFKQRLLEKINEYSNVLKFMDINPPILLYITLNEINGMSLSSSGSLIRRDFLTKSVEFDFNNINERIKGFLDSLIENLG